MTAVTLSVSKAEVIAARYELQSRLPARTASFSKMVRTANRCVRISTGLSVFGFGALVGSLVLDAPANTISGCLGLISFFASACFLSCGNHAIRKFAEQRCADIENRRESLSQAEKDAYCNLVKAYAATRKRQKTAPQQG